MHRASHMICSPGSPGCTAQGGPSAPAGRPPDPRGRDCRRRKAWRMPSALPCCSESPRDENCSNGGFVLQGRTEHTKRHPKPSPAVPAKPMLHQSPAQLLQNPAREGATGSCRLRDCTVGEWGPETAGRGQREVPLRWANPPSQPFSNKPSYRVPKNPGTLYPRAFGS